MNAPNEALVQEPVAWMANDGTGRVIDAKTKDAGTRAAATRSATTAYSIPLYPHLSPVRSVTDALEAAAMSLRAIANLAGCDELMQEADQIRGYANSRAKVAEASLESFRARLAGEGA